MDDQRRVAFLAGVPASRRGRWRAAWTAARKILRGNPPGALVFGGDVDITADIEIHGAVMIVAPKIEFPELSGKGEGWWMDEQDDGSWLARTQDGA